MGDPRTAWIDGRLVPWAEARVPVSDRGLQFAESLYEVLPVIGGRPRLLAEHVARMRAGAAVLGLERGVPPRPDWERIAEELVTAEDLREGLLYAQMTGGPAPRRHVAEATPCFFAYLTPHRFPRAADLAPGLRAITLPDLRWERCDLKTTMLLPAILARREAARRGADEALLLGPDGDVREGTSTSVFVVEADGIHMPPQDRHQLPGITQPLVAGAAREAGIPVFASPLPLARLMAAREVFVSATSRLAMPVTEVDGRPVGGGEPGPVVREIARRLRARLGLEDAP